MKKNILSLLFILGSSIVQAQNNSDDLKDMIDKSKFLFSGDVEALSTLSNIHNKYSNDLMKEAISLANDAAKAQFMGWNKFSNSATVIQGQLSQASKNFTNAMSEASEKLTDAQKYWKRGEAFKEWAEINQSGSNRVQFAKTLDVAGKAISAYNVYNNFGSDYEKSGVIGAVGLGLIDSANIFANDANPFALTAVGTWFYEKEDCTKSHLCTGLKGISDPLGTLTGVTREVRDGLETLTNNMVAREEADANLYKQVNHILKNKIWSSPGQNNKIYTSESFDDLVKNANEALDFNLKQIDSIVRALKQDLEWTDNEIEAEKNKPFLLDWGTKDIIIDTHNTRKAIAEQYIKKLTELKNEINSSRESYLEEYAIGWLQGKVLEIELENKKHIYNMNNQIEQINRSSDIKNTYGTSCADNPNMGMCLPNKTTNMDMLNNLSMNTQDRTSHFGATTYLNKFNSNQTQAQKINQEVAYNRQTPKENFYYESEKTSIQTYPAAKEVIITDGNKNSLPVISNEYVPSTSSGSSYTTEGYGLPITNQPVSSELPSSSTIPTDILF